MFTIFIALVVAYYASCAQAFHPLRSSNSIRSRNTRVNENFGYNYAEDPYANTPEEILGEVNLKDGFVKSYMPDALLLSNDDDLILKIRKNRLLKTTVESGLLDALEAQGLTFSKIEKLLPVIDDLGLLPLAVKNKDVVLSIAPLIVDTAFLGLPLATNIVGIPPSTYSTIAFACFALFGYEGIAQGNAFLAVLLAVLGTPAVVLGSILSQVFGENPPISSYSKSRVNSSFLSSSSSSPGYAPAPKVSSSAKVSTEGIGGQQNGKRKTIKI